MMNQYGEFLQHMLRTNSIFKVAYLAERKAAKKRGDYDVTAAAYTAGCIAYTSDALNVVGRRIVLQKGD